MSYPLRTTATTMAGRVSAALETLPTEHRVGAVARRAVMYAQAIDDDDQGDALFRFGPKLHTALETLGLAPSTRALLLPRPMSGSASNPAPGETLVARAS